MWVLAILAVSLGIFGVWLIVEELWYSREDDDR